MDVGTAAQWAMPFMLITGSTKSGPHSAVLVGGSAACGFEEGEEEADPACDAFGAFGLVFMPRPPESVSTPDGRVTISAEAIARRGGDGLTPIAWRDLRLNRAYVAPKPGSLALVGYAGGFISLEDVLQKGETGTLPPPAPPGTVDPDAIRNTLITIYSPYERPSKEGAPTKAHAVILDPVEEAISVIHAEGQAVLMQKDGSITMQSPNGKTFIKIEDGKISMQADQIFLNGGKVVIGDPMNPATVPLTAGVSSPPCPRLFVSPVA